MQDLTCINGMVLKAEPIGEYDRRVVILSAERGKISCFAKGARRLGSRFMAATNPLCFGEFKLFSGRSSYSLNEAIISNYFSEIRDDFEAACYGMYFLELADYYTVENNDEKQMLKLLYQSVRALSHKGLSNALIRCVYEIKALAVNGEFPGVNNIAGANDYDESTLYALKFIEGSGIERLYTFTVSDKVLSELILISDNLRHRFIDKRLKSLEILDAL